MIELILAGFLSFGLPPATTPVKACTNWSKRVGCATNHSGGRDHTAERAEALDKALDGYPGGSYIGSRKGGKGGHGRGGKGDRGGGHAK